MSRSGGLAPPGAFNPNDDGDLNGAFGNNVTQRNHRRRTSDTTTAHPPPQPQPKKLKPSQVRQRVTRESLFGVQNNASQTLQEELVQEDTALNEIRRQEKDIEAQLQEQPREIGELLDLTPYAESLLSLDDTGRQRITLQTPIPREDGEEDLNLPQNETHYALLSEFRDLSLKDLKELAVKHPQITQTLLLTCHTQREWLYSQVSVLEQTNEVNKKKFEAVLKSYDRDTKRLRDERDGYLADLQELEREKDVQGMYTYYAHKYDKYKKEAAEKDEIIAGLTEQNAELFDKSQQQQDAIITEEELAELHNTIANLRKDLAQTKEHATDRGRSNRTVNFSSRRQISRTPSPGARRAPSTRQPQQMPAQSIETGFRQATLGGHTAITNVSHASKFTTVNPGVYGMNTNKGISDPKVFSNNDKEYTVEDFLIKLEQKLKCTQFQDQNFALSYVQGLLGGNVAQAVAARIPSVVNPNPSHPFENVDELVKFLYDHYGDKDRATKATTAMLSLKQNTDNFTQFYTKFQQYRNRMDLGDTMAKGLLLDKLNYTYGQKLLYENTDNMSFTDLVAYLYQLESKLERLAAQYPKPAPKKKDDSNNKTTNSNQKTGNGGNNRSDDELLPWDKMPDKYKNLKKLDAETKLFIINKKGCTRCRELDHGTFDKNKCPMLKVGPIGRSTNSSGMLAIENGSASSENSDGGVPVKNDSGKA